MSKHLPFTFYVHPLQSIVATLPVITAFSLNFRPKNLHQLLFALSCDFNDWLEIFANLHWHVAKKLGRPKILKSFFKIYHVLLNFLHKQGWHIWHVAIFLLIQLWSYDFALHMVWISCQRFVVKIEKLLEIKEPIFFTLKLSLKSIILPAELEKSLFLSYWTAPV